MAKDKIFVQNNNEVFELTGKEKDEFLEQQKIHQEETKERFEQIAIQKELKISAYKKLGLTDEEIAAII